MTVAVPDREKPPHVLVVDDDEGLLILLAGALEADGMRVKKARSATAALAAIGEQLPDLVVLDLKLPDLGWRDLFGRLRQYNPAPPFIVVTGQGDERVAVEVMKEGALDYVVKNHALLDLLPTVVRRAFRTVARDRELAGADAQVRASEARFAAVVHAIRDGVWEWNIPEGRAYYSDRWKAILGHAPGELTDRIEEWEDRVHPGDRLRLARARDDFFAGRETLFGIEYRLRHRDGSYRWLHCRGVLARDEAGQPLRMTAAHSDITDRKLLEREVLRISDREQWRIGQDLHDGLGQQLTAIELLCEGLRADLAQREPGLVPQARRIAQLLRESISQTRALAHGLTPFKLDATGLAAALAELAARTNTIGRGATCRYEGPASVVLDDHEAAGHLYRIAQEAVGNALRHSGARAIVIRLTANPATVRLEVADDGSGMKRTRRKPGIGLSVMRHRASTIGAELAVASMPGKGLTVTCILSRSP